MAGFPLLRQRGKRPSRKQRRDFAFHAFDWRQNRSAGKTFRRSRHHQRSLVVARQPQARLCQLPVRAVALEVRSEPVLATSTMLGHHYASELAEAVNALRLTKTL